MKKGIIALLLILNGIVGYSQQWKYNLNEAFKEAAVSGKEVLLFFSVSEACETCKKLEETIFQSALFKSYAAENYILVKQDFSSKTEGENMEENLLIVEKYNKDGFFPLVVIINKNQKVLGKIGVYKDETPAEYLVKLQSLSKI